jgi:hypothetical protein
MPILLFFKAEQFGLFEKLVPIKGHVTPDGTAIAPHMAIRHVRAPQAKVHKPAQAPRPPEPDLFAAPAKVTKPKGPESLDLFAERPTPAANPGNYNAFKNGDVLIWTAKDKIGREYEARGRVTDQHGGNTVMAVVLETQGKGSVPQPGQSVRIFNAQAKLISRGDVSTDAPKTDTSPEPVQKPAEPEAEAPGVKVYRATSGAFSQSKADDSRQYWTDSRAAAEGYADNRDDAEIAERQIDFQNPYLLEDDDAARDLAEKLGETWDYGPYWDLADNPSTPEVLAKLGYDGLIFDDSTGAVDHKTYMTFPKGAAPKAEAAPVEAGPALDNQGDPIELAPFDASAVEAFGVPAGTSKEQRRQINATAEALLMLPPESMSPADMATLRAYSGEGGCGDSGNEYYTDPKVAAAMWSALESMGAVRDGATALEPSCATGVFLQVAPANVKITGVEMDPTSARIGEILHPTHEVINASLERFACSEERQFDVVIGNAPFGVRGSLLHDDKRELKTAQAYFLDTAIDKTRAGGVVAMIVPTGVLDSKLGRKDRDRLLRKAEFLGALRMPNTAFEAAHTGVTTDIVFFRKRPDEVAGALGAATKDMLKVLGVWDDEYLGGGYFYGRGAENILGTMTEGWRTRANMGDDITVEGSMIGVPEAIAAFTPDVRDRPTLDVATILAAAPDEATREAIRGAAITKPYRVSRRGDTKMVDGVQYIFEGQPLRWHRVDQFMQLAAVTDGQALAADIEMALADDSHAAASGLADKLKAYVEAHGLPSKNPQLMLAAATDKQLYRLIGAVKPDGTFSDLVTGKKAAPKASSFDAAAQTLALEEEWFTPEQVAGRWSDGDTETVLDHLYASPEYALDPAIGHWTSLDQYLSGELWPKLDLAQAQLAGGALSPADQGKVERQAKLLEEVIDPKSLEDVDIEINSAFLPLNVVAAFFNRDESVFTTSYAPKRMEIAYENGYYTVSGGPWSAAQLLPKYLNRSGVRKEDDLPVIDRWNREFKEWLCSSAYRDEVEDLYNRKFRGFRQREYSDAAFDIPGLRTEGLKAYQYAGLRWALEAGKGIIAADVGLGKTVRGLILARLAKVNGHAEKPIIVVPKQVLANWADEAEKWFPGSTVLTIGETFTRDKETGELRGKADSAAERNRKYHDLTQNDYDFILISQPAWNDLDLDPSTKGDYVEKDFWVQRGDALGNEGNERLKAIRKAKESFDQQVAGRQFQKRTDVIYFNDLGVDMIIGDEFHAYKNLYAARDRRGSKPKFLGGSGLSNRALDTNLKCRWLLDKTGGRNVYGLTATPTKNSPLEVYSMLSHIAPEAFENIGIRNSEEFLDRFCEFSDESVLNTTGSVERALVTAGFKNLDELRGIMRRFIDRKTAEDVGLQLPKRDDRMHAVPMSAEQEAVYVELRIMAEEAAGKRDATGDGHIFSIMDKMGKAAMDLELYDPGRYKGARSPKYDEAATHIIAGAGEGGQVVFADSIGVHQKMVDALVAGGLARDQIGIINAKVAKSSAARQNIADAFNAGKLRVVIGNTATMGEGINLQKGTTDIHHLDLPWDPASVQQRNGRGLRQGNLSEAVRIHTYLAKGSFDGYRYQTLTAKKDWQDLLWNGGDRVENLSREGVSRDDMMIMLSADPEAAREKLATDRDEAAKRLNAQRYTSAADDFGRFKEMQRSFATMKTKDQEKPSGQRLKIRLDRARVLLEENAFFKAKHALDSNEPTVIDTQTGEAYSAGAGIELPATDSMVHGGGKFVVMGVANIGSDEGPTLRVRRYGQPGSGNMLLAMKDLNGTATAFKPDEKAEQAELSGHMAKMAEAKLGALSGMSDLHGLPSAALEGAHDSIQHQLRGAMDSHKWYPSGGVPMIDKETALRSLLLAMTPRPRSIRTISCCRPTPIARRRWRPTASTSAPSGSNARRSLAGAAHTPGNTRPRSAIRTARGGITPPPTCGWARGARPSAKASTKTPRPISWPLNRRRPAGRRR